MGEVMLPQGPEVHCGESGKHRKHPNVSEGVGVNGTWCSGVPVLSDFVELTVRVPVTAYGFLPDKTVTHKQLLALIYEEGLGSMILDYVDHPDARAALRVRAGQEDQVYSLRPRSAHE